MPQRPSNGSCGHARGVGEAMGGLRYVVGDPSTPPSRVGVSIGDSLAATFGALGGLMALHARERSGRGQVVDAAIYEAVLAMMESLIPEYQVGGYIRERTGAILPNVAPSNVYPTADGQMILVAANQDTVFQRLAAAIGRPELADDERYATHSARGEHQQELDDLIAEWTGGHTADAVIDLLNNAAVPTGRIYRAPEMLEDPHFAARNIIVRLAHPDFGEIAMQDVVPRLSETPGEVRWVGFFNDTATTEIYTGLLGKSREELALLREKRVI